jgi:hypothetical protein
LAGLAAFAVASWLVPTVVWARTTEIASYPISDVWPAAVRFMRVDRGFPVREKDEAAGYILFEYTEGPKSYKGSLELIRANDSEGREATRIAISIPDLSRRVERMLLDRFVAKLSDDHGPPAPPPRKSEPARPDASATNPAPLNLTP